MLRMTKIILGMIINLDSILVCMIEIRCLMLYHINDGYALLMAIWPKKATSFL